LANYGSGSMMWGQGDFNYDGTVNFADLSDVLANYGATGGPTVADGQTAGVSPVPEPTAWLLLFSAVITLLLAKRWRRRSIAQHLICNRSL
jgi:hypothetical protein